MHESKISYILYWNFNKKSWFAIYLRVKNIQINFLMMTLVNGNIIFLQRNIFLMKWILLREFWILSCIFHVSVSEYFWPVWTQKSGDSYFFNIFSAFLNHEEPICCHTFWSQFCCHMVWFFRAICKLVLRLFLRHGGLPHLSLTWCEFLKPSLILGGSVNVFLATLFRLEFELIFFENYIPKHLGF